MKSHSIVVRCKDGALSWVKFLREERFLLLFTGFAHKETFFHRLGCCKTTEDLLLRRIHCSRRFAGWTVRLHVLPLGGGRNQHPEEASAWGVQKVL